MGTPRQLLSLTNIVGMVRVAVGAVPLHACVLVAVFSVAVLLCPLTGRGEEPDTPRTGSVIFIHPDGTGLSSWTALRVLDRGPDGETNWDRMEAMGIYRGHLLDCIVSTSQGGATVHAYGVKADHGNYGSDIAAPIQSLSGEPYSIMVEARERGKSIGIINSGHIAQPGTGVFVASVPRRVMREQISDQVIRSGADVIMGGGEVLLLPEGVVGRHGVAGTRKDGRNLIDIASDLGYTILYTRDELMAVPDDVDKLLGIFSAGDMFNDRTEEALKEARLPLYNPQAPTVAEMTEVALRVLKNKGKEFLLVVEEEGADNFGNVNNARGMLEALRRADAAIGVAMDYTSDNPNTLVVTAADSDAGGMRVVWDPYHWHDATRQLPATLRNGAPLDGRDGTGSGPFWSAPDRFGSRLPFGIAWAAFEDVEGGIVARAHGLNAELLPRNVDNTDIYRLMYATLFGSWLPAER